MKSIVLLTVFFIASILSAPTIPEVFTSNVQVYVTDHGGNNTIGNGVWTADQPNGKNVERHIFSDHMEEHLDRFDLHRSFDVFNSKCDGHALDGEMPHIWTWLMNATEGSRTINGKIYDVWTLTMGYATLTLAVDNMTTPVWLIRESQQRSVSLNFLTWTPSVTHPEVFDVPTVCPAPPTRPTQPTVGCVARTAMIDSAEVWVKNKVPYNQGGDYDGYREDCSGYVSMCWESAKPGHTTETLGEISKEITKADLMEGDCLLCASEHVVLFGGWADAGHTQYIAYEETRPGEGTVKRVTPYPYWYNQGCFIPHRYDEVC
jgi:hypothetical protein